MRTTRTKGKTAGRRQMIAIALSKLRRSPRARGKKRRR